MGASEKAYDVEQRLNSHISQHRFSVQCTTNSNLSTSLGTVPGLSVTVPANAVYQVHAFIGINIISSGGTLSYSFSASGGMTTASFRQFFIEINGTSVGACGTNQTMGGAMTGSVVGTGLADRFVTMEAGLTVGTSGGTFNLQAALSSGSGKYYQVGTYMELTQIF